MSKEKIYEVEVTETIRIRSTYYVNAVDADDAVEVAEEGDTLYEKQDPISASVLNRFVNRSSIRQITQKQFEAFTEE